MINNRQAGRRRGRGGGGNGQRQGNPGRPDNGNRIDSRARGNAAQLLEKYKSLASDAQRQGDRVNTEYYLQFADHYFRVLSESRSRFEDQQVRRPQNDFDADGDEDYGDEGEPIRGGEQQAMSSQDGGGREPRGDRGAGEQGPRRDAARNGRDRDDGERAGGGRPTEIAGQHQADPPGAGESLDGRAETMIDADAPLDPPRRRGRPRRSNAADAGNGNGGDAAAANGFEADRLPPALGVAASDGETQGERPRRRRLRTPSDEAPAAE